MGAMVTRKLGKNGPEVSAIGLGLMGMSDLYGPADREESIAMIRAALDAGVPLLVRTFSPRFQGENLDRNLALVGALRSVASAKGETVSQAAIAWVLSRGGDIVPLVGARKRERLSESLHAMDLALSDADLAEIERSAPPEAVAGDRYNAQGMASLDSERG